MSKILVVDDEQRYRDHICRALQRDDHEVRVASDGPDAISIGTRFRPEVLVTDWMLKDNIHGLHVSETLRAVVPEMQTILITGYPSFDLRTQAQRHWVAKFIEKPFELVELREAVSQVEPAPPDTRTPTMIAILELDLDGMVGFANARARDLFGLSEVWEGSQQIDRELYGELLKHLPAGAEHWVEIRPGEFDDSPWYLHTRSYGEGCSWLVVLVPAKNARQRYHPVVRMLLDLEHAGTVRWPFDGRALLIDRDDTVRRTVGMQIELAGGFCHTTDRLDQAWRLYEKDPGIELIILDYDLPVDELAVFIRQVYQIGRETRILGTGGDDRAYEFSRMEVHQFLLKPWTITDLLNILLARIGNCAECGLPLPLRIPVVGESSCCWVCAGCGKQYRAVLDERYPSELLRNVHSGEQAGPGNFDQVS